MACLLEDDPNPDARAQALATARDQYRWDHSYLDPLPMLKIDRTGSHAGILEFLAASVEGELPPEERPDDTMPEERLAATAPGVAVIEADDLLERFGQGFLAGLFNRGDRLDDPSDYLKLIKGLPHPPNLAGAATYEADWDSDRAFAWQRLAGPNPVVIERPTEARWAALDGKLNLRDVHLAHVIGDRAPTVDEALQAGTLFVCDYAKLVEPTPIPCGSDDDHDKFLPAPIGVFWYDDELEELRPIAIRMGQSHEAHLVTADGSERWQAAKAQLAVADFNYHEMGTHLSLVHFVQEGIAVATFRSLPPAHPVTTLLRPHFKYLLYNNFAGRELLVEDGGFVQEILAGDLENGSLALVRRFYTDFHFDDLDLPAQLDQRNMTATEGLPVYPYRDDGLEVWAALQAWATAYVAAYYDDDDAVAKDVELDRWCGEMTHHSGAHLAGFPTKIADKATLASILTRLMFLAGPQHAAVNYPQAHSMLVVPNMPGAAYAKEPSNLMQMLPPSKPAHAQIEAIWLLTCYQYGRLGDYGGALTDTVVQEPLRALQKELDAIERRVDQRNQTERATYPYTYLKPSRIPNSTNI